MASWGEFLAELGFARAEVLEGQVRWWLTALRTRRPGLVVADYAPCAMLAARIAGVPALVAGNGFGAPPAELERFPDLFPDRRQRIFDEAELVETVNRTLAPLGLPLLGCFPEVYRCAGSLITDVPLLDPYASTRAEPPIPPAPALGAHRDPEAREVFTYLSADELAEAPVMSALLDCPFPVRAFLPSAREDQKARLRAAGVIVEPGPVAPSLIAARSRLILCSAQRGTAAIALSAGLPLVMLPQHFEQRFNAMRIEVAGTGRALSRPERMAGGLAAALATVYADEAMQARARDLAGELAGFFGQDAGDMMRRRIAAACGGPIPPRIEDPRDRPVFPPTPLTTIRKLTDRFAETEDESGVTLLRLETGDFYRLSGAGLAIWRLIETQRDQAEISEALCARYEVSRAACAVAVAEFVAEMEGAGFIGQD